MRSATMRSLSAGRDINNPGTVLAGHDALLSAGRDINNAGTVHAVSNDATLSAGRDITTSGLIQAGHHALLISGTDASQAPGSISQTGGLITAAGADDGSQGRSGACSRTPAPSARAWARRSPPPTPVPRPQPCCWRRPARLRARVGDARGHDLLGCRGLSERHDPSDRVTLGVASLNGDIIGSTGTVAARRLAAKADNGTILLDNPAIPAGNVGNQIATLGSIATPGSITNVGSIISLGSTTAQSNIVLIDNRDLTVTDPVISNAGSVSITVHAGTGTNGQPGDLTNNATIQGQTNIPS